MLTVHALPHENFMGAAAIQVRCVDKATGDMMVRYTMAAQSALDLLQQLLLTCSHEASGNAGE